MKTTTNITNAIRASKFFQSINVWKAKQNIAEAWDNLKDEASKLICQINHAFNSLVKLSIIVIAAIMVNDFLAANPDVAATLSMIHARFVNSFTVAINNCAETVRNMFWFIR